MTPSQDDVRRLFDLLRVRIDQLDRVRRPFGAGGVAIDNHRYARAVRAKQQRTR